jgi:uncharacterized DUF497 family protein
MGPSASARGSAVIDFDGFDWDDGNWPKCGKHGLEMVEIEAAFYATSAQVIAAPGEARAEQRWVLIAYSQGRWVNVVFTLRGSNVRPISARFMHRRDALRHVT